jgi:hypothetical protein
MGSSFFMNASQCGIPGIMLDGRNGQPSMVAGIRQARECKRAVINPLF